jgi:hypothetical protein
LRISNQNPRNSSFSRSSSKITLIVRGGLGNQLFQYAAARSLSDRKGYQLTIDNSTGFRRDHKYRRTYLLDRLGVSDPFAGQIARCKVLLYHFDRKLSPFVSGGVFHRPYGNILVENSELSPLALASIDLPSNFIMDGYWQNKDFFSDPSQSISRAYLAGLYSSQSVYSPPEKAVAVCIRLYEEVKEANSIYHSAREEITFKLISAIEVLSNQIGRHLVHIYSSISKRALVEMGFPEDCVFFTCDSGPTDPVATLRNLVFYRRLVITPSSLYWWAAWLSQIRNKGASDISVVGSLSSLKMPSAWKKW